MAIYVNATVNSDTFLSFGCVLQKRLSLMLTCFFLVSAPVGLQSCPSVTPFLMPRCIPLCPHSHAQRSCIIKQSRCLQMHTFVPQITNKSCPLQMHTFPRWITSRSQWLSHAYFGPASWKRAGPGSHGPELLLPSQKQLLLCLMPAGSMLRLLLGLLGSAKQDPWWDPGCALSGLRQRRGEERRA